MSMKEFPDFIEKRLLEEYKEQGLCWRHDDEWFSKLTAVLLPLSIGALTLPYLKVGVPKLLAVIGGLMLMAFWFFSSCVCTAKLRVRFLRIHDIERILGLDSHLRYDAERGKGAERDKRVLKAQGLRRYMFGLYLPIAFLVTCDMKVEVISWPLDWGIIKSVIATETIAFLIIIVAVVIVVGIETLISIGLRHFKKRSDEKRWKRSPKGHSNPSEINASNTDYQ